VAKRSSNETRQLTPRARELPAASRSAGGKKILLRGPDAMNLEAGRGD
jgi:hypothetical protein